MATTSGWFIAHEHTEIHQILAKLMLLTKVPGAANLSRGGTVHEGPAYSTRAGACAGSVPLMSQTWESGTSCGGLCFLAQVTPGYFCVGELGKKLFGFMPAFGTSSLLVAASSLLSSACAEKASQGFL